MTEAAAANSRRVAVIGGGVSGLVAAYRLVQAGQQVTLFEPERIGGVISSLYPNGFTLEQGPNVILKKPALNQLLTELDLNGQKLRPITQRYHQYVWFNGQARKVPKDPLALALTPLLSTKAKLKLIPKLFSGGIFDCSDEQISVAKFFEPLLERRGCERMLQPALKGIFGGDIDKLQARAIFPELWQQLQAGRSIFQYLKERKRRNGPKEIFVLKGGNQLLTDKLLEKIRPKITLIRQRVLDLAYSESANSDLAAGTAAGVSTQGARADWKIKTDAGEYTFDSVVIATSGPTTSSYLRTLDSNLADQLALLRYAAIAVVHLGTEQTPNLRGPSFGILFPENTAPNANPANSASPDLLGVMFNSQLFPHLVPGEKQQLLTVCLGGVADDILSSASAEQLAKWAQKAVSSYLGVSSTTTLATRVWPLAIPQYEKEIWRAWELMERAENTFNGLLFVGAERGGPSVPDRVQAAWDLPSRLR